MIVQDNQFLAAVILCLASFAEGSHAFLIMARDHLLRLLEIVFFPCSCAHTQCCWASAWEGRCTSKTLFAWQDR